MDPLNEKRIRRGLPSRITLSKNGSKAQNLLK